MANWVDGYALLTGRIEDILEFITMGTRYEGETVDAKFENEQIIFSDNFIPENLYILDTTLAFIGFERKHDVKTTAQQDIYEISVTWDQMHGFIVDEFSLIAKRYRLMIRAEGIVFDLAMKQRIIVNQFGDLLLDECIEYHREDYDPNDDYKKSNEPLKLPALILSSYHWKTLL